MPLGVGSGPAYGGWGVGVGVCVGVLPGGGVLVNVGVGVRVGVCVGVGVRLGDGVKVGVAVGCKVGDGSGDGVLLGATVARPATAVMAVPLGNGCANGREDWGWLSISTKKKAISINAKNEAVQPMIEVSSVGLGGWFVMEEEHSEAQRGRQGCLGNHYKRKWGVCLLVGAGVHGRGPGSHYRFIVPSVILNCVWATAVGLPTGRPLSRYTQ